MKCSKARRRSADFADGRLGASEYARLAAHLESCASCSSYVEQLRAVRSSLRSLPAYSVPSVLRSRLRVTASSERQAIAEALGSPWKRAFHSWCFRLDQMMRPFTMPATGGVLSTLILFSALAFTIDNPVRGVNYDVPLVYADSWKTNLVPLQLRSSTILTLSLDGNGRIMDYAVRNASADFIGNTTRLERNNISLPDFRNVLAVAQPTNRDISISFVPMVFRR